MSKIGIITGSGIGELTFAGKFRTLEIKTKYGLVVAKEGKIEGKEIICFNRHGVKNCPPHEINFRANIWALKQKGVEKIIATAAVGSLSRRMQPGDFVLLSDFIDFSWGRKEYFNPKNFVDVSFPYDKGLRKILLASARRLKIKIHPQGVYVCTQGPRFESCAEIKMYQKLGAEVVGMTNVPEVVLAAEVKIPYVTVAVITNYAAGISPKKISSEEVVEVMKKKNKELSRLILETIFSLP